jgi:hypothetical protein
MHLGRFSNSYQRRVRVTVIPVPDGCVTRGGMVFEAVDDQFDGSGGVGGEDEVEVGGIGVEETKSALSNSVDPVSGNR